MYYRNQITNSDLRRFHVVIKETNLFILAETDLTLQATQAVQKYRRELEDYIRSDPDFLDTFTPYRVDSSIPWIVQDMARASECAGVGPMAAVAGAIAERVGLELLNYSSEVVVENGGDIFIKTLKPRTVGIYAGRSIISHRVGLRIEPEETPLGICTSSGTVGPSISFGRADAVVAVASSTPLADAAATFIGNSVKTAADIPRGLDLSTHIPGLKGVIIIKGADMGIRGDLTVVGCQ
ncbi:MAG: UPF0280 family protein [bacterium]